jgi:predicted negative regulator of RcsB-dependent stress response
MNDQTTYELYYQAWIKQRLNKILLGVFIAITFGFIFELNGYIQNKHQNQAQVLFEQYHETANSETASYLTKTYPAYIQTHLVLFLEAKNAFDSGDTEKAIEHLEFIQSNSKDTGIQKIAIYRLCYIYIEQHQNEKARSLLAQYKDDSHAQLQLALTESDPKIRSDILDNALEMSESRYLDNMIITAQHDNNL